MARDPPRILSKKIYKCWKENDQFGKNSIANKLHKMLSILN